MGVSRPGSKGPSASISELCIKCNNLFSEAEGFPSLSTGTKAGITDLRYRYLVWAGNVGAFAKGGASIDSRLKGEEDIVELLAMILAHLAALIRDLMDISLEEVSESESQGHNTMEKILSPSIHTDLQLGVPNSSGTISKGGPPLLQDGSGSSEISEESESEEQSLFESMKEMVDRLYRFSSVLRKPVSSTEDARVRRFLERKQNDKDIGALLDHDALRQTALFWIEHWRLPESQRPVIPKELTERLVNSILYRRAKLVYRERHQTKLKSAAPPLSAVKIHILKAVPEESLLSQDSNLDAKPAPNESLLETGAIKANASSHEARLSPFKYTRSTANVSDTIASSVDRSRLNSYAKSVALSRIAPSTAERQKGLDLPKPHGFNVEGAEGDLREVECSYCCKLVKVAELKEPYWTKHLLRDIEPYVCLFRNCSSAGHLFGTPEEWLSHMQSHTSVWCCEMNGHDPEFFESEDLWKEHMSKCHPGLIAPGQLPYILKSAKRTVEDPFIQLASEYLESYSYEEFEKKGHICLLCSEFPETDEDTNLPRGKASSIYHHMLFHLEQLSLLSLVAKDDNTTNSASFEPDDVSNNQVQEGSGMRQRSTVRDYESDGQGGVSDFDSSNASESHEAFAGESPEILKQLPLDPPGAEWEAIRKYLQETNRKKAFGNGDPDLDLKLDPLLQYIRRSQTKRRLEEQILALEGAAVGDTLDLRKVVTISLSHHLRERQGLSYFYPELEPTQAHIDAGIVMVLLLTEQYQLSYEKSLHLVRLVLYDLRILIDRPSSREYCRKDDKLRRKAIEAVVDTFTLSRWMSDEEGVAGIHFTNTEDCFTNVRPDTSSASALYTIFDDSQDDYGNSTTEQIDSGSEFSIASSLQRILEQIHVKDLKRPVIIMVFLDETSILNEMKVTELRKIELTKVRKVMLQTASELQQETGSNRPHMISYQFIPYPQSGDSGNLPITSGMIPPALASLDDDKMLGDIIDTMDINTMKELASSDRGEMYWNTIMNLLLGPISAYYHEFKLYTYPEIEYPDEEAESADNKSLSRRDSDPNAVPLPVPEEGPDEIELSLDEDESDGWL